MWVYTKSRGEHDHRMLLNLNLGSRISITALGDRWFIDVIQGPDTVSIAQVTKESEALAIIRRIYNALEAGVSAIDLDQQESEQRNDPRE